MGKLKLALIKAGETILMKSLGKTGSRKMGAFIPT
jgi:hypothetical protein